VASTELPLNAIRTNDLKTKLEICPQSCLQILYRRERSVKFRIVQKERLIDLWNCQFECLGISEYLEENRGVDGRPEHSLSSLGCL